jgi:hypothetical protein
MGGGRPAPLARSQAMRDAIQAYACATWAAEAAVRGAAEADTEQGVRSVLLNNRLWICAGEEVSKGGRRVSQAQLYAPPQAVAVGGRPVFPPILSPSIWIVGVGGGLPSLPVTVPSSPEPYTRPL